MEIWERMEFLRTELERHNKLYYENDAPEISDFEYDAMLRELEDLEQKYPIYATPDSPTKNARPLPSCWTAGLRMPTGICTRIKSNIPGGATACGPGRETSDGE